MADPRESSSESTDMDDLAATDPVPTAPSIPTADFTHLVNTCQMAYSDVSLSAELVETAIKDNNPDLVMGELPDLEKAGNFYDEAYKKILQIGSALSVDLSELAEKRKIFLLLLKNTRAKILKLMPSKSNNNSGERRENCLKLPKVDIACFSGNKDEWSSFKAIYTSYIHENENLDNLEKLRYLKSKLKGNPASLIEAIPLEEAYYTDAWNIILSHFDDPFKRISRHLDAIVTVANTKRGDLRSLVTHFRAQMTALKVTFEENAEIDILSQFGIHAFLQKADKGARLDWEREMERRKRFASFNEFITFMEGRCNAYERAIGVEKPSTSKGVALSLQPQGKRPRCFYCSSDVHFLYRCEEFLKLSPEDRLSFVSKKKLCKRCFKGKCNGKCTFKCGTCNRLHNTLVHVDHLMHGKDTGESLDLNSYNVDKQPISIYTFDDKTSKNNSELDSENVNMELEKILAFKENLGGDEKICHLPETEFCSKTYTIYGWVGSLNTDKIYSLLATAVINITNAKSGEVNARALLDSGSQFNFITTSLVRKLEATPFTASCQIRGIEGMQANSKQAVNINLQSRYSKFTLSITCLIVDNIVDILPSEFIEIKNWHFPKYLSLADPHFNIPNGVDLLLGASVFWKSLKPKFYTYGKNIPKIFSSHFGWLVAGDINHSENDSALVNSQYLYFSMEDEKISETIERLWLLDESNFKVELSPEELECEKHFLHTHKRSEEKKFKVKLPFKMARKKLGKSRPQAMRRFLSLEKRLSKNPSQKRAYTEGIHDYLDKVHMVEITSNEAELDDDSYYIPHHAIIKEGSTTTKIRIVFDASMPTTSGLSLNQCLMAGPVVQSDLISVLLRSRVHLYVFSADITQMYRQVLVDREDTPYLRILWRDSPDEPIKTYEMITVPFGLKPSPFLATRCLKKLAEDQKTDSPAKTAILKDFYVDDLFTGGNSLNEVTKMRVEITNILLSAGFQLSKWCSNNKSILAGIPGENLEKRFPLYFGNDHVVKTLGLIWDPSDDIFRIWVHLKSPECLTKRQVLSIIASIFDPFGLLGPVIVVAKLIMQLLWQTPKNSNSKQVIDWSDNLPKNIEKKWLNFATHLDSLKEVSIPRHIFGNTIPQIVELHGFSDASEKAYGAVIYIRSLSKNACIVKLLCSKSRVAPLKRRSLPQLELCAALVLAELVDKVKRALQDYVQFHIIRLWSDSEIVLCWLGSSSSRWETFVANRVQKIHNLQESCLWDHVPSKENPADLLSRGVQPNEIKDCEFWWHGPSWLSQNSQAYSDEIKFKNSKINPPEVRHSRKFLVGSLQRVSSHFERFSNFTKLTRITALCIRFTWNLHWYGPHITGPLQCYEIKDALNVLIKLAQSEHFSRDIRRMKSLQALDKDSKLIALSPILDALEIIRVGGRLENSNLSYEQCHPVILPSNHSLTELIIKYEHECHFHAGPQLLRSVLRRKFWILKQNTAIQKCLSKCLKCIRMKAETHSQFMAALPRVRVVPSKVFQVTGVDYAGPIKILKKRRGRHMITSLGYIAVFVCFATKAIHLELVSNLTSEHFLAALNRFIGRRGLPTEIWSDNGTTFVGAKAQIKKLYKFLKEISNTLIAYSVERGVSWTFIPPHAPHFGGLWEAGVKSVKKHLKAVTTNTSFTYEQYETLLIQIEACLNSRPLCAESNDPNEINALTPGHFLVGGPLTALPNPDLTAVPVNRLKYWELVLRKGQEFWKRWRCDYLNTMQQRSKWRQDKEEVRIDDVVIVKEDNTPPLQWPIGQVTATHPSSDGKIRVVTVRMKMGDGVDKSSPNKIKMSEFRRPITKLILLPREK